MNKQNKNRTKRRIKIKEYIKQLKKTYQFELYYFTLIGTLALIDICGALNSSNGEASGTNFACWFKKYLFKYSSSTFNSTSFFAEECYKLRCRLLHQARAYIDSKTLDTSVKSGKIAFRIGPGKVHMCNFNGMYYLDIENFMNDVIECRTAL